MDKTKYTTEHRKGQHLTSEERHIIEVRLNKDKASKYAIAKEFPLHGKLGDIKSNRY